MDNEFVIRLISQMGKIIGKYIKKEGSISRKENEISFASFLLSGAFLYLLLEKLEYGEVPDEKEIKDLAALWLNGIKNKKPN
ncbi:MAG: hypothetical protein PWP45_307 [Tepidanaerobacteraceae bacterium]|nr:hypothetical protein [Tepidanaerobacteraceae bacterium]